jgi:hypothetical protein
VAHGLRAAGVDSVLGGVAWERIPVDPYPGPRPLADIHGARQLDAGAAIIDPDQGATTPEGAHFCESRLATFRGERTVLIDVSAGPGNAAAGIDAAASELGCDLIFLVDIGGDAIADGSEPGLASPLCDAVMIAAGARVESVPCLLGVLGAGCDGELQPAEVLGRVAALARAGAWLGTLGVSPAAAKEIEDAAVVAMTEASLLVAYAARGREGPVEIRGGRRTVDLSPLAALTFVFDPAAALAELPLVRAIAEASSIEAARDALNDLGISTELDYEEGRVSGGPDTGPPAELP